MQFGRDDSDKNKNVDRMLSILPNIKNVDIVCLPEAWIGGGGIILEEKERESLLKSFCHVASENNYNLLTGGLFNRRAEKIFDTCHVIRRDGKIAGFYDKHFPSAVFKERNFCNAGDTYPVFTIDEVIIGIVICVDVLYPELVRKFALKNVQIIFNPSNIPRNRSDMWKHASVTRAVENTVFFVFANNTHTIYPDGRAVEGHSIIVSPNGDIIFEADEKENIYYSEIDLNQIDMVRKRWRYLDDIRKRPVY